MEHILLVVHVFIAAALIGLVLLQRSESDGFGLGSGSGGNLLSGRATANLLTRMTSIVAGLFILNSLVLSVMAAHSRAPSIVEQIEQQQKTASPVAGASPVPSAPSATPEKPAAPAVPLAGADHKEAAKPAAPTAPESAATPTTSAPADEKSHDVATPTPAATPVKKASKPKAKKPAASTDAADAQNN